MKKKIHYGKNQECTQHQSKDGWVKEIHQFALILPVQYYGPGSYTKWIRVGWALKNTDNKLFITWLALSCKSPDFKWRDVPELYERWNS